MRCLAQLLIFLWLAMAGCQALFVPPPPSTFRHELQRNSLMLHSDFPLPDEHRLINELLAAQQRICQQLALPPSQEPIHIYLFGKQAAYDEFIRQRFPAYVNRRAIFVGTEDALSVYAQWGDHVAEDLRHEVAHGYLHAAVPNLPLWLDEGLAEYFEVPYGRQGLNLAHLKYLHQHPETKYDLAALEQLRSAATMTQAEYAQSWAWVHFLLESSDDQTQVLTDYLAQLATTTEPPPLSTYLHRRLAHPKMALAEHLESLR